MGCGIHKLIFSFQGKAISQWFFFYFVFSIITTPIIDNTVFPFCLRSMIYLFFTKLRILNNAVFFDFLSVILHLLVNVVILKSQA